MLRCLWYLPALMWTACIGGERSLVLSQKSVEVDPVSQRSRIVRTVLSQSVRVIVASNGETVRSASGVVFAVDKEVNQVTTYVITNAHVVANSSSGSKQPQSGVFVLVDNLEGGTSRLPARVVAKGKVPKIDLAVLAVPDICLPPAKLAKDQDLSMGDELVVIAAPYGRALSVSGGLLSQVDYDPEKHGLPILIKTDAAIGYGASGGGIFHLQTGRLIGIVEGYRTAKVSIPLAQETYSFDIPMPGETFAAPAAKIRQFLKDHGLEKLVSVSS